MNFILQYLDFIWLPVGLLVLHRGHRLVAAGFFLSCMLMMRMQTELMAAIDFSSGLTGLIEISAYERGQITYSVFYVIYIALALYSPGTRGVIFMAASISMFFAALFVSTIVMVI